MKFGEQYNIFDFIEDVEKAVAPKQENSVISKYDFIRPKKEMTAPQEYVVSALMRGSGFEDGKFRIRDYVNNYPKVKAISLLKHEYGHGGSGWPLEGFGLHGVSYEPKGITIEWRDEEGEKECLLNWNIVYANLVDIVNSSEYITEVDEARRKFHKLTKYLDNKYGHRCSWGKIPTNLYNKGITRVVQVEKEYKNKKMEQVNKNSQTEMVA